MRQHVLFLFMIVLSLLPVGCASLPKNVKRTPSLSLPADPATTISKNIRSKLKQHNGLSGFHALFSGEDAFISRVTAIRAAERSLDLQYYIWNNDLTGKIMIEETLKAADRGVRVRILLDDLNLGKHEKFLRHMDMHPNIEIRMVNPFAHRNLRFMDFFTFNKIDKRMHNKVFIVDGEIAIVGGRNIGDEYFWASNEMNFGDLDIWAIGPVVPSLSHQFDTYWNAEISYPIESLTANLNPSEQDYADFRNNAKAETRKAAETEYIKNLSRNELENPFITGNLKLYWATAQVIFDPPEKFDQQDSEQLNNLQSQISPFMKNSKKEILMISPYFVPGEDGVEALKKKIESGTKITVLTNSLASGDVAVVFSGYKGYRKDLLRDGVLLYELKPKDHKNLVKRKKSLGSSSSHAGLHGKTLVFDRKKILVGSMNLDPRSVYLNTEVGVIIDSPEMAEQFSRQFEENLPEIAYQLGLNEQSSLTWTTYENGVKETLSSEPETSWWQRAKASMLSWIVPERQL
ncbi:phospholipase D family protein [Bdellovibrio sp. HCB274]|uniref:phospholipase D family protein n=1 Tax=Bdellovibrio sp. HCB274 TaxID=3394361 RepID=UPI0039B3B664